MIPIAHRTPHLFREDAYKYYCRNVDAYGSYEPSSFIFLSYEAFYDFCKEYGLELICPKQEEFEENKTWWFPDKCDRFRKDVPTYGLIDRFFSKENVQEIFEWLKEGKNVIALFPGEVLSLYYRDNTDLFDKAVNAFKELGCQKIPEKFLEMTNVRDEEIYWEKIDTDFKGKLFITKDTFLSDAFFLSGYGKSDDNTRKLEELLEDFSTFTYPLLRIEPEVHFDHWPCNEPIKMSYKITNHGPAVHNLNLNIIVDPSVEPMDATQRRITLHTGKSLSIPITLISRSITTIDNLCLFETEDKKITLVQYHYPIEILPDSSMQMKNQLLQDSVSLERLLEVFENTPHYNEIKKIAQLIQIDIDVCLNKIRTVGELIAKKILQVYNSYN